MGLASCRARLRLRSATRPQLVWKFQHFQYIVRILADRPFVHSCHAFLLYLQTSTSNALRGLDRELSVAERTQLKLHLSMCRSYQRRSQMRSHSRNHEKRCLAMVANKPTACLKAAMFILAEVILRCRAVLKVSVILRLHLIVHGLPQRRAHKFVASSKPAIG